MPNNITNRVYVDSIVNQCTNESFSDFMTITKSAKTVMSAFAGLSTEEKDNEWTSYGDLQGTSGYPYVYVSKGYKRTNYTLDEATLE
jgi:hypothetical protein